MSLNPNLILGLTQPPAVQPRDTITSSFNWATVTGDDPVAIQMDGELAPLLVVPDTLIGPLTIGERVFVQRWGRRVIVLGRGQAAGIDLLLGGSRMLTGGGARWVSGNNVSWDNRFLLISMGHNPNIPDGFFDIAMPPDNTVIPVHGSLAHTEVTVSGGLVPLVNWETLWYDVPLGSTKDSLPANFHITGYTSDFVIPPTWVPIVLRNGDAPFVTWGDGRETGLWTTMSLTNSWTNYGSGYAPAQYRRENGIVYIQGLIKTGTVGAGGYFTLPAGFRPSGHLQWTSMASGGVADLRVFATGVCAVYAIVSGTSASVSITTQFPADA